MHMYNEYVASTGVKDWRRTMLDEELHTSYLKQLHLPKDMDNLFESDAKEFQKMMMALLLLMLPVEVLAVVD